MKKLGFVFYECNRSANIGYLAKKFYLLKFQVIMKMKRCRERIFILKMPCILQIVIAICKRWGCGHTDRIRAKTRRCSLRSVDQFMASMNWTLTWVPVFRISLPVTWARSPLLNRMYPEKRSIAPRLPSSRKLLPPWDKSTIGNSKSRLARPSAFSTTSVGRRKAG